MKSVTFENLKKQNYTMKESLRALKTNIQFCGDDICTIVVTSAMPNEGKSTVTMDLARSFFGIRQTCIADRYRYA